MTIWLLAIIVFFSSIINGYAEYQDIPENILKLTAPAEFKIIFETTKGDFEVQIEKKFSPLAVDRLYQLVQSDYFTNVIFYRCVPNFVVQFGTLNELLDSAWSKHIILDEPVKLSNDTGTISFARAGKNTRGTQLFINLKNNSRLDTVSYGETLGFPAFGKVTKGVDIVYKLFMEYGDEPRLKLDGVTKDVEQFIKSKYPKLDYIKRAYIKK